MKLFVASLSLIAAAWLPAGASARDLEPAVVLRDTVTVSGDTLRLSDLLPVNASGAVRETAAAVVLGRAPLPGSARILEAEQVRSRLGGWPALLRQLVIPARITVRRSGWRIERGAVWTAVSRYLQEKGWKQEELPSPEALRWPDAISSQEEEPRLQATGAECDSGQRGAQIHVRCVNPAACASFLVQALAAEGRCNRARVRPADRNESPARQPGPGPTLVAAGKPASLIVQSAGIRISLPVICLQRGALGQQIRVREADGHRVFRGQVVGEDQLRAIF